MIKTICARFKQGYRTIPLPVKEGALPERFLGRPGVVPENCRENCGKCQEVCPTGAITGGRDKLALDLGKCLFCGQCQNVCFNKAITFTGDYQLSARKKDDLIARNNLPFNIETIDKKIKSIFGRSLKLRQVSAGGCNACELDINVLNTVVFDLGRFGIQFVASPRHADGLVVTGPVTANMRLALEKTYKAIPSPKIVIALGACAISGGPYINHKEVCNGCDSLFPVDLYIPGCPPHPLTILKGILELFGIK